MASVHPYAHLLSLCLFPTAIQAQEFTIPVVVHVLHENGPENISDAQVYDALAVLNSSFQSIPASLSQPEFADLAANMEIAFCLADLDPDGAPTTGIDRVETPLSLLGGAPGSYVNQWPTERYMNIWVVGNVIESFDRVSLLPAEAELEPEQDGIMIRHSYFGRIGTGSPFQTPAITYAAGRFLGLKRLWEDPTGPGDCGDDGILDTPACTAILLCPPEMASCTSDLPAMVTNYMTYSYCNQLFTLGQKAAVYATLESSVASRSDLVSNAAEVITECGATAVAEDPRSELSITAFPNPFRNELCLNGMFSLPASITLFDPAGRKVPGVIKTTRSGEQACFEPLGALDTGIYLLLVTDDRGERQALKVVRD